MALIVAVHGVGHQFGGEETSGTSWLQALRDGLRRCGIQEARLPRQEEFRLAFYGDLFRSSGSKQVETKSAASQSYRVDVLDEWEKAVLRAFADEVKRTEIAEPHPLEERKSFPVPQPIQSVLRLLSRSKFFGSVGLPALIGDVKQTRFYLRSPDVRYECRRRLARMITEETRIVIGHSLGSIVAYETLCEIERCVPMFITLGSPLGIRNLIFENLDPTPESGKGKFPKGASEWSNIADLHDIVALTKQLAPLFDGAIVDSVVSNGIKAHDACRYLTSRQAGEAIVKGLDLL